MLCEKLPLRTDEFVFFRNLTKIDTDENKAIYSKAFLDIIDPRSLVFHKHRVLIS